MSFDTVLASSGTSTCQNLIMRSKSMAKEPKEKNMENERFTLIDLSPPFMISSRPPLHRGQECDAVQMVGRHCYPNSILTFMTESNWAKRF
jgi:hypothetical protein